MTRGASYAGVLEKLHETGRTPIDGPKRYRAVTFPFKLSPAIDVSPVKVTSTRKSGRLYAATRNEPWTDFSYRTNRSSASLGSTSRRRSSGVFGFGRSLSRIARTE